MHELGQGCLLKWLKYQLAPLSLIWKLTEHYFPTTNYPGHPFVTVSVKMCTGFIDSSPLAKLANALGKPAFSKTWFSKLHCYIMSLRIEHESPYIWRSFETIWKLLYCWDKRLWQHLLSSCLSRHQTCAEFHLCDSVRNDKWRVKN